MEVDTTEGGVSESDLERMMPVTRTWYGHRVVDLDLTNGGLRAFFFDDTPAKTIVKMISPILTGENSCTFDPDRGVVLRLGRSDEYDPGLNSIENIDAVEIVLPIDEPIYAPRSIRVEDAETGDVLVERSFDELDEDPHILPGLGDDPDGPQSIVAFGYPEAKRNAGGTRRTAE